jgi:hypothetical protein
VNHVVDQELSFKYKTGISKSGLGSGTGIVKVSDFNDNDELDANISSGVPENEEHNSDSIINSHRRSRS